MHFIGQGTGCFKLENYEKWGNSKHLLIKENAFLVEYFILSCAIKIICTCIAQTPEKVSIENSFDNEAQFACLIFHLSSLSYILGKIFDSPRSVISIYLIFSHNFSQIFINERFFNIPFHFPNIFNFSIHIYQVCVYMYSSFNWFRII